MIFTLRTITNNSAVFIFTCRGTYRDLPLIASWPNPNNITQKHTSYLRIITASSLRTYAAHNDKTELRLRAALQLWLITPVFRQTLTLVAELCHLLLLLLLHNPHTAGRCRFVVLCLCRHLQVAEKCLVSSSSSLHAEQQPSEYKCNPP